MREIIGRVESLMGRTGFECCKNMGCFDVAAKKGKNFFILKILRNVDSLQEEHADSLKTISAELGGRALIIGEHTRKETLEDGIIYQRFDIPTIGIETLENILTHKFKPMVTRNRGGLFVEIDSIQLKKKRISMGLTQEELAMKVGTTKKGIYEHEKQNKKASKELVDNLEAVLGKISSPASIYSKEWEKTVPRGQFEGIVAKHFEAKGFETNSVYHAPFNIIAKSEDLIILSEAEENREKIEKILEDLISFSRLARKPIIAVTREEEELEIPTIQEKDLGRYSTKDLRKLLRAW
jgi:putative transcriptional regulator